jgi:hypothetical protein
VPVLAHLLGNKCRSNNLQKCHAVGPAGANMGGPKNATYPSSPPPVTNQKYKLHGVLRETK